MTAFTSSAIQYMKCCTFFQLLQTVFAIQVKKGKLRSLFIIQCVRKHKQITFKINKLPKKSKEVFRWHIQRLYSSFNIHVIVPHKMLHFTGFLEHDEN